MVMMTRARRTRTIKTHTGRPQIRRWEGVMEGEGAGMNQLLWRPRPGAGKAARISEMLSVSFR
jgi:hypothetical protein